MLVHLCPHCRATLIIPTHCAGTQIPCPTCAGPVQVPGAGTIAEETLDGLGLPRSRQPPPADRNDD